MIQQYILYKQTNPFLGYIQEFGYTDPDQHPDGSTGYERIEAMLTADSDLRLNLRASHFLDLTEVTRKTKKLDLGTNSLVTQDPGDITPEAKAAAVEAAKVQALVDNLPSWAAVSSAVDGIASLADARVFLKKLARVVYWLAKNAEV